MKKIDEQNYMKLMKLLDNGINYPEVISIIEKNNPGEIFVDDIDVPSRALVWSQGMKGFYFIGDSNCEGFIKQVNELIDTDVTKFLKEEKIDFFEVSGTTGAWENTIERIFHDKDLKSVAQLIYTWDEDEKTILNKEPVEETYKIHSIKDSKVQPQSYTNWSYYESVLKEFWGEIDTLKERGNCYYAVDENRIIGICYSGFVTSCIKTVGIETDENYRKQGIGYHLAHHCINEILEEGSLPWWDCTKENIPSLKLAEKLGFVKHQQYRCYYFKLS